MHAEYMISATVKKAQARKDAMRNFRLRYGVLSTQKITTSIRYAGYMPQDPLSSTYPNGAWIIICAI